jgi:enhanced entry protein EnhC
LVTQDNEQANTLINTAIEQGYVPAFVKRAELAASQGDYQTAKTWYTKASDAGDLDAILALASLYLDTKNPLYHPETGVTLVTQAAEKHSSKAALLLAELYKTGQGVAANEALSKTWSESAVVLKKEDHRTPVIDASLWLSNQKMLTLEANGYGLQGIFSTWQNPHALAENNYNAAPQMQEVSRASLYKPRFVMTEPNSIPLIDYYDAYVRSSTQSSPMLSMPRYSLAKPAVTDQLIEKAILGDSFAQFALGQLYQQGIGVDKNIQEAIKYYTQSAAQQDLRAEYNLGLLYLEGETGKPDYQQAFGWLNDAAFKGSADAQYVLGQLAEYGYRDANGVDVFPVDHEQARAMYSLAAANHQGMAQFRLAELLTHDHNVSLTVVAKQKHDALMKSLYQGAVSAGVKEAELPLAFFQAMSDDKAQQTTAFQVATREADTKNPQAMLLLGLLYDRGIGVAQSRSDAIDYYEKVENNPVSAFILGTYSANGDGISRDVEKSRVFLQQALAASFSYAPLNLAVLDQREGHDFVAELVRAHELGNSTASLLLADYYLTTSTDANQMKQARDIYQALADRGSADGQMKLGYMYEQGLGGVKDIAQAAVWYEQAAVQDQAIAQYRLGRLNQLGWLAPQPDYEAAKKWYAEAIPEYLPAAVALGFLYDTEENNYQHAQVDYEIAANKGDAVAQYNLGLIFEQGKGVPVQMQKAASLYQKAADAYFVPAMVQLAGLYLNGSLGERDEKQAINWYQKAADKKNQDALYQLGLLSETGIGMARDDAKAVSFYQASANQGNAKAMLALARLYQYGLGVAQNNDEAVKLYKELAMSGNAYAAYQLAVLAHQGVFGEQAKQQQTKQWLQLATENGSQQASQVLQWLNAQMDTRVSFIEPIKWQVPQTATDGAAHWMYLGALSEWNQGNEGSSRTLLSQLLQAYPNYEPAKEAYHYLQAQSVWSVSAQS